MTMGTTTASFICIPMLEDRLKLAQWLSPAFPIGGFGYSQGLETPMSTGVVATAAEVERWVRDVLRHGAGGMDAVFVARAHAGDDPALLSDWAMAYASCAERATELTDQGRAFGQLMTAMTGAPFGSWPYPVAVGLAARSLNLPRVEVLALFLHGVAAQMVSAATRFLPLGQSEAQALLMRLAPLIAELAEQAERRSLDDIFTFTPGADLAGMQHETLEIRIFRT